MNLCGKPAPLLLGRVCTHQEARGIIQEAAKAAHKVPLQEGVVFWGQLIWLVDDNRRVKTLPCCGREGLREDRARIHSGEGWRSPALGTAAVCRVQQQKLGEGHNIWMKLWPEPHECKWCQQAGLPASLGSHTPRATQDGSLLLPAGEGSPSGVHGGSRAQWRLRLNSGWSSAWISSKTLWCMTSV